MRFAPVRPDPNMRAATFVRFADAHLAAKLLSGGEVAGSSGITAGSATIDGVTPISLDLSEASDRWETRHTGTLSRVQWPSHRGGRRDRIKGAPVRPCMTVDKAEKFIGFSQPTIPVMTETGARLHQCNFA